MVRSRLGVSSGGSSTSEDSDEDDEEEPPVDEEPQSVDEAIRQRKQNDYLAGRTGNHPDTTEQPQQTSVSLPNGLTVADLPAGLSPSEVTPEIAQTLLKAKADGVDTSSLSMTDLSIPDVDTTVAEDPESSQFSSGAESTRFTADTREEMRGDIGDTYSSLAGDASQAGQAAVGLGEAAVDTAESVPARADAAGDTATAFTDFITGKKGALESANQAGRGLVNIATGGNAEQWREDFWEQEGNLAQSRARVKQALDDGGIGGKITAFGEATRVGIDAGVDNPHGPNVQDAATGVLKTATLSPTKESLANKVAAAEGTVQNIGSTVGKSVGIGNDGYVGAAGGATSKVFEWFVADPIEGTTTAATGINPETGETEARAKPVDLIDAALIGGTSAVSGVGKAADAIRGGSRATRATDEAAQATDDLSSAADESTTAQTSGGPNSASPPTVQSAGLAGGLAGLSNTMSGLDEIWKTIKGSSSGSDEAAAAADEAATGADDAAGAVNDGDFAVDPSGTVQGTTVDDAVESGALETVDEFDQMPSSARVDPNTPEFENSNAVSFGEGSATTDAVGGSPAGATPSPGTSVDDVIDIPSPSSSASDLPATIDEGFDDVSGSFDDLASGADDATDDAVEDSVSGIFSGAGGGDEAASGIDDAMDFGAVDDTVEDATQATDEVVDDAFDGVGSSPAQAVDDGTTSAASGGIDEAFERAIDATEESATVARARAARAGTAASGLDEVLQSASSTDEFAALSDDIDDLQRQFDEIASGADEGASGADDVATGASGADEAGGLLGKTQKRVLGGALGLAFLSESGLLGDILGGLPGIGGGGSSDATPSGVPGPTESNGWRQEIAYEHPQGGVIFKLDQKNTSGEYVNRGFTTVVKLPNEPPTMLSSAGQPVDLRYVEGTDNVLQPVHGTLDAAKEILNQFLQGAPNRDPNSDAGGEDHSGEDDDNVPEPGGPEPDPVGTVNGSMDAPGKVRQGQSFNVSWSASLPSGRAQDLAASGYSRRLMLAFSTDENYVPLANSQLTFSSGRTSAQGTFEVPNGWGPVAAGDYELYALVIGENRIEGSLASASVTVQETESGDKSEEGSKWEDPTMVRELPKGWYLFAQTKVNSAETRFMVVGKRDQNTRIYVHDDGVAREDAFYFPSVEKAVSAFKKWLQRLSNGNAGDDEQPNPSAGRPSPSGVKKDAAQKDESGARGVIGKAMEAAERNPMLVGLGAVAAGFAVWWAYQNGHLDFLKPYIPDVSVDPPSFEAPEVLQ